MYMKNTIKCKNEHLKHALLFGGCCAGANKSIPILSNAKVSVSGQELTVESTSLSVSASRKIECQSESDISFCIDCKSFLAILSTLKDEIVLIEVEDGYAIIRHSNGRAKLPTFDPEEFPEMAKSEMVASINVSSEIMLDALMTGSVFTGNDELRPNMMSVFIEISEGKMEFCATDAHILVHDTVVSDSFSVNGNVSFMVARDALRPMCKMLEGGGDVNLSVYGKTLVLDNGVMSVTANNLEGKYPNFKPILEATKKNTNTFEVGTTEFDDAVARALVCSNNNTSQIRLSCTSDGVEVSAEDIDYNRSYIEGIKCVSHSGDHIVFGLNANFVKKVLSTIKSGTITICASQPNLAVTLKDGTKASRTLLVMPVMLNE